MKDHDTQKLKLAASPAEVAEMLGLHPRDIHALIEQAEVPVYQFGLRRRVFIRDVTRAIRRTWRAKQ